MWEYVTIEDIPCTDLRTIDQLWVKYSDGHFGFSVQKRIWEELGGKVDAQTENMLAERIGWSKGGRWLYACDLTFSLALNEGFLPLKYYPLSFRVTFSQRLVDCGIEAFRPSADDACSICASARLFDPHGQTDFPLNHCS